MHYWNSEFSINDSVNIVSCIFGTVERVRSWVIKLLRLGLPSTILPLQGSLHPVYEGTHQSALYQPAPVSETGILSLATIQDEQLETTDSPSAAPGPSSVPSSQASCGGV